MCVCMCKCMCMFYISMTPSTPSKIESEVKVHEITNQEVRSLQALMDKTMYQELMPDTQTACHMFKTGRSDGAVGTKTRKGYAVLGRGKGRAGKIYAHQVAYAAAWGVNSLPADRKHHVSHLCHNKLCVNVEHLTVEPDHYNRSRNYCPYRILCRCCEGERYHMLCKHRPRCLAPNANSAQYLESSSDDEE